MKELGVIMTSINSSNFTQIPNDLMDILLSSALSDNERKVLLFIARKTYGFHKETDTISLTQFQNKLGLSRQGVVNVLKRLQLVNLCRLVKKGNSKKACNEWTIDLSGYHEKLVNMSRLVKFTPKQLVNIRRPTKESITKEKKNFSNFRLDNGETKTARESFEDALKRENPDLPDILERIK